MCYLIITIKSSLSGSQWVTAYNRVRGLHEFTRYDYGIESLKNPVTAQNFEAKLVFKLANIHGSDPDLRDHGKLLKPSVCLKSTANDFFPSKNQLFCPISVYNVVHVT